MNQIWNYRNQNKYFETTGTKINKVVFKPYFFLLDLSFAFFKQVLKSCNIPFIKPFKFNTKVTFFRISVLNCHIYC